MVDLGPYYITQLDAKLNVEWQYRNTNTKSCGYDAHHALHCTDDHPERLRVVHQRARHRRRRHRLRRR